MSGRDGLLRAGQYVYLQLNTCTCSYAVVLHGRKQLEDRLGGISLRQAWQRPAPSTQLQGPCVVLVVSGRRMVCLSTINQFVIRLLLCRVEFIAMEAGLKAHSALF